MKKILVLTSRYPYPVIGGDRLRIYHLCKALSQKFHLTLASLCERPTELRHRPTDRVFSEIHRVHLPRWKSYRNVLRALSSECPLQLAYYESPEYRRLVERLLPSHDLVLAHLIRTAQFVPPDADIDRILEMTDAISMNYARMQSVPENYSWKKQLYEFERERVATYERQVVDQFHKTWLVSGVDAGFLGDRRPGIEVIPNGVDRSRLPLLNGGNGDTIAFIGNMVSAQNQDACYYFADRILPLIRRHADIRLRVIGNCRGRVRNRLEHFAAVEVTGMFDRIEPHLSGVFAGICSVRAAAGIQNKVLEYLAMGLPCVTTPEGAEGLDVRHGQHLLIYHSPEEAAEQVLALHRRRGLRQRLGNAGAELIAARHDWSQLYGQIIDSVDELLEPAGARPQAG
jgi:glycosyltransferase involved in cell wall biosynthesis